MVRTVKNFLMWERGQWKWESYRNIVTVCRDKRRKTKVHLERSLAKDVRTTSRASSCVSA